MASQGQSAVPEVPLSYWCRRVKGVSQLQRKKVHRGTYQRSTPAQSKQHRQRIRRPQKGKVLSPRCRPFKAAQGRFSYKRPLPSVGLSSSASYGTRPKACEWRDLYQNLRNGTPPLHPVRNSFPHFFPDLSLTTDVPPFFGSDGRNKKQTK